jgi:hypothetical protein
LPFVGYGQQTAGQIDDQNCCGYLLLVVMEIVDAGNRVQVHHGTTEDALVDAFGRYYCCYEYHLYRLHAGQKSAFCPSIVILKICYYWGLMKPLDGKLLGFYAHNYFAG